MASKASNHLLVAALDFGTTFSGWSFLFKHQYKSDPTKVFAKNWNNGSNISSKTPTTILIKPDGRTVEAFGYEAEDRYAELAAENKHMPYFYFRRFKMMLFEKINLKRDMILDDENGQQLEAITVFSLSIQFLKEDLLKECQEQIYDVDNGCEDIHWVITVPAIWNECAKQFMREAAKKAGIPNKSLTVALEPEAASLFCKHLSNHKLVGKSGISLNTFAPGVKYIILDAGGGTVDITVHEVLNDGRLKELHAATGGAWGGTKVDEKFNQFLIQIFGAPIMVKFKRSNMDDYIEVFRIFEVKKREVAFDNVKMYQIRLPASLVELFQEETDENLKETITQIPFSGKVSLIPGNKLKLDAQVMKGFFHEAIQNITGHLVELMQKPVVNDSQFILMVGGFSECKMLQQEIRNTFPLKVIVATEASLAVLKGAVIFGHQNNVIITRISRYTYGFKRRSNFIEGFHPESNAVTLKNRKICEKAFIKLVTRGESFDLNERKTCKVNTVPKFVNQIEIAFSVFASRMENPPIVDESCIPVGILTAKVNNIKVPLNDRAFIVSGIFGQTELQMEVKEVSTGQLTTATFDML